LECTATQEQSVPSKAQEEVIPKETEESLIQHKEATVTIPTVFINEQQREQEPSRVKTDGPNSIWSDIDLFNQLASPTGAGKFINDLSLVNNTLVIVVSDEWQHEDHQTRLQAAMEMWKWWAALRSADEALISIVDKSGDTVGGSDAVRDSHMWVKEDAPPVHSSEHQDARAEQQPERKATVEKTEDRLDPASSGDRIEVSISVQHAILPDGRVQVYGKTNLPVGTELMISVREKVASGFYGQSRCTVTGDGAFRSESFGRADGLPKGVYEANVVMPIVRLQPRGTRHVVGENGEKLAGPLVTRDALGVSARSSAEFTLEESSGASVKQQGIPALRKSMPNDPAEKVTYSIIKSSVLPGIKRSLDVRLSRKVPKADLHDIALELRAQDSRHYERTFICYYLPGMVVGSGAWATTHFNPNLDVRILGMTVEQESMLKEKADDSSRQVIGRWLDEGILNRRITFFKQDGRLIMERLWSDGSRGTDDIIETSSNRGRMFQSTKGGGDAGEYYLIDNQGNLQLWDRDGLVFTARRID